MKKKIKTLSEEDFAVLNGPLESGRQSPGALGVNLILVAVMITGMLILFNWIFAVSELEEGYSLVLTILIVVTVIGIILIMLSVIFSIKGVYETRQAAQYFIVILVTQYTFGLLLYLAGLFIILHDLQHGYRGEVGVEELALFAIASFSIGIFIFIFSFIRFVRLLKKGKFRKNTSRDKIRGQLEARTDEFKKTGIFGGIAMLGTATSIFQMFPVHDAESLLIVTIGITLFFVMLFILPEQLVSWYCIKKFNSFRY